MTVIVATKELVDTMCLGAITNYSEAGHFVLTLFATVATVHYLHKVSLFHMQEPNQCLLVIVIIARVPFDRYVFYSVGQRETFTQKFIASLRERYRPEKYIYVHYVHEFAPENSLSLSWDRDNF